MTTLRAHPRWSELIGSADFARAFTVVVLASIAGAHAIQSLAGLPALVTVIAAESALALAILFVRREEFSAFRLIPFTLVAFVVWALASTFWSTDPFESFLRWLSLAAVALLAVTIGHIRDTLQTVRAVGDVTRALLLLSLAVEIASGILFDMPFAFLGVRGDIADFGPIQGIFGTRNMLGFICVVALVTFIVELRTRSVRTGVGVGSIVLASTLALLSASPTVFVLAAAVSGLAGVLYLIRRVPDAHRTAVQWTLAGVAVVVGSIAWSARAAIIDRLGAADDLSLRTDLWRFAEFYVRREPVLGWGWFGPWDVQESPFAVINWLLRESHSTALNAFVDVLLQLGWAGVVVFVVFFALTFARSWVDASRRRAAVHAWVPLMVATLATVSMFESFTLFGIGWLLLVVCAVRAGQSRSWRRTLDVAAPPSALPGTP